MAKRKCITIHDIARELGTTASTVSRALQDHPRISTQTKEAVRTLARKLDYQPNYKASSLRLGKGSTIGVLIPQISRQFFATVIGGIEEVASAAGYNVLICQSYESLEREKELVRSLLFGRVDGLIASISIETDSQIHFEMLHNKGVPLAFFDRVCQNLPVSKVVIDDYLGAKQAVEHLIKQGYRRIAHFAGPQHINVYHQRLRGYSDALNEHNLPICGSFLFKDTITQEAGINAMENIQRMDSPPDAIFSAGDLSALGAMLSARRVGIKIPEQIAICGFANEPFGELTSPTLTSVEQHGVEMGRQVASLLIEEIETKTSKFVPRTTILTPKLITRESSQKI